MTPEEEDAFEALAVKAQKIAKDGDLSEAELLVRRVPSADRHEGYFHEKVVALIEIAAAQSRLRLPRSEALLREVETLAENLRLGGIWHEADALTSIGDIWASRGERAEAVRLFRKAVGAIDAAPFRDDGSDSVLARLAARLRLAGAIDEAEAIEGLLPPRRRARG